MHETKIRLLAELLESHEEWLMERILSYALAHDYAKFTSTLKESWRMSIAGLTQSFLAAIKVKSTALELKAEEDYTLDPVAVFGILEGKRHRERGIDIGMFLGLLKYYRQSYQDLIAVATLEPDLAQWGAHYLERGFDRIEIGLCAEWISGSDAKRIQELQTANREMTNEKNKYLTLFESLANPVILLDYRNCIENINHAAAVFFNSSGSRYYSMTEAAEAEQDNVLSESLIGKPAAAMMPWIADELVEFATQAVPGLECEKALMTGDAERYYQIKLSPMMDISGKFNGMLIILNDITERTQALERLTQAKAQAEAANLSKSQFLANMSHELRTPMNAILGFAQLSERSPDLPPEHKENLMVIRRNGEHLLRLINDVLDMSKIEAGRMILNPQNFDLKVMLDDIEDLFKLRAESKNLHLIFDRAPNLVRYVQTDEIKLRQVLINLLGNAIKFTQEGGIALRARSHLSENDNELLLCFEIEDTGPGMTAEEQTYLFQTFTQTKTGKLCQEGTGLGLVISKKFIEMMGGEIGVVSKPNHGTVFSFQIRVRAVLCGGAAELIRAGFETLTAAGYDPEIAYFECLHELKLIVDLIYEGGLSYMRYSVSDTAEYGDYTRGPRVVNEQTRAEMKKILAEIQSGEFAKAWMEENRSGRQGFLAMRASQQKQPIETVGAELREMMTFLKKKKVEN